MVDWNDNTLRIIVNIISGTCFLVMFSVLTILKKKVSHIEILDDFKFLAAFGLLQGLSEYSDIPRFLAWEPAWVYDLVRLLLVSSSFAALLTFGLNVISTGIEERRWYRGISYGAFLMYIWMLIFVGIDFTNSNIGINYQAADLAQRHSLGLIGATVTAYAFIELTGKINAIVGETIGNKFMYAGIGFFLYGIFGGIIVEPIFGLPAVIYRTVIAVVITITVIGIFELFEVKKSSK